MRELTEQQQLFLDVLFAEAGGDLVKAKKLAGYSDNTPTRKITNALKEEIVAATQMYLATHAPKAAMSVIDAMYDPTELGIKDKLSAARDLLDRVGLAKTEKIQVEATNGVMILPAKKNVEE